MFHDDDEGRRFKEKFGKRECAFQVLEEGEDVISCHLGAHTNAEREYRCLCRKEICPFYYIFALRGF